MMNQNSKLFSLFLLGILFGLFSEAQAIIIREPDYYEDRIYNDLDQEIWPVVFPQEVDGMATIYLADRKNTDEVFGESTIPEYRVYPLSENNPGAFQQFSVSDRFDDRSDLFHLYPITVPTSENGILIVEIRDVDYGPFISGYTNRVENDYPRSTQNLFFAVNTLTNPNSFVIISHLSPERLTLSQQPETSHITSVDYSISFPEVPYFYEEFDVPFNDPFSVLELDPDILKVGAGIFTITPKTASGSLDTQVIQLPFAATLLDGIDIEILNPANGSVVQNVDSFKLPIDYRISMDQTTYDAQPDDAAYRYDISSSLADTPSKYELESLNAGFRLNEFVFDDETNRYYYDDQISLEIEPGETIEITSRVVSENKSTPINFSQFDILATTLEPKNIITNVFQNGIEPQKFWLNVRFDTNQNYHKITGRYSSNLPYKGELFDIDFEETYYNPGFTQKRRVGFQFLYEPWIDVNHFEFSLSKETGETDSFELDLSGEQYLTSSYPDIFLDQFSTMDSMLEISGGVEPNDLQGFLPYQIVRKINVLVDSQGQFLDTSGWQYQTVDDIFSDSRDEWNVEIPIETGYNKIVVQPIRLHSPTSFANPAILTVRKFTDPVEPANMATLTEHSDIWFNEATPETSANDFENSVPYRTRFLGFFHDAPNGLKVFMEDVNDDGLEDAIHVTAFGEVWLAINDGAGNFEDPYRTNGYFLHDEFIGWKVLLGDLNKDSRADLIQITDLGQIWISYAEELEGGVIDYSLPEFVQNSPLRFDPENTDIFMADMTGDFRDDLVMIDNTDQGRMTLMEFQYTRFDDPVDLGVTGFSHTPSIGGRVMIADVTNDGFGDVVHITAAGEVWVAISENSGTALKNPESWGNPGFRSISQPNDHWWMFITKTNDQNKSNLYCVNEFGELWKSELYFSGNTIRGSVGSPEKIQSPGFRHEELGNWQTYFGRFVP